MTSYARYQQLLKESAERFARDTDKHEITVLHDDGLYRHVRCAEPGTGMYSFNLITWPGYLTICGDMPVTAMTFRRTDDMFDFFGGNTINPGYWAEKLVSGRDAVEKYSMDLFKLRVDEHVAEAVEGDPDLERGEESGSGLAAAVESALTDVFNWEYEDGAREFLRDFGYDYTDSSGKACRFEFTDSWEWSFTEYDWSYLWACHAIRWGVARYDAAKGGVTAAERAADVVAEPVATHAGVEVLVPVGGVL